MSDGHPAETDEEFVGHLRTAYQSLEPGHSDLSRVRTAVAARSRRRRLVLGGGAFIAAAATVIVGTAQPWSDPGSGPDGGRTAAAAPVVVQSAPTLSEAWPSETLADWAGWADAVVVAKVTAESEAGEFPAADGSGEVMIGRTVRLEITDVLWSRGSALAAGGVVELSATGWLDRPGTARSRLALPGVPRMEVDNSYVVALRDQHDCAAVAAQGLRWAALGSSAIWPVDGSTIGTGESEGRWVTGDVDQASPRSLEAAMTGRTVADLRRALADTGTAERPSCRP